MKGRGTTLGFFSLLVALRRSPPLLKKNPAGNVIYFAGADIVMGLSPIARRTDEAHLERGGEQVIR